MVRAANIGEIGKVVGVLSSTYSEEELESVYMYLSMKIRDTPSYSVLIDSSNSMIMILERAGNFKAQFHVYSTEDSRGSNILVFGKECAKWISENTNYTSLLSFVRSRHASIFIRKFGLKPIGNCKDAGGVGEDEMLFCGSMEEIKNKLKLGGV